MEARVGPAAVVIHADASPPATSTATSDGPCASQTANSRSEPVDGGHLLGWGARHEETFGFNPT